MSHSTASGAAATRRRAVSISLDWDNIIKSGRRFSSVKQLVREQERPKVDFCTGSSYTGTWNTLNMSGYGTYQLPYGVIYEGYMMDGMFHGEGTLTYQLHEQKVKGIWDKGRLIKFRYEFADGLLYSDNWSYCQHPDRRFYPECYNGLMASDKENLTADLPTRKIADGCYDTGDGFYNPKTRCVMDPRDFTAVTRSIDDEVKEMVDDERFFFRRSTTTREHKTIVERCRKAWDEPTGHRPDLYEMWFTGRSKEMECFDASSSSSSESTFLSESNKTDDEDDIVYH